MLYASIQIQINTNLNTMYIPMYIFKFDSKANKFSFVPELDIFNPQCYLQVKLHLLAIEPRHCLICLIYIYIIQNTADIYVN